MHEENLQLRIRGEIAVSAEVSKPLRDHIKLDHPSVLDTSQKPSHLSSMPLRIICDELFLREHPLGRDTKKGRINLVYSLDDSYSQQTHCQVIDTELNLQLETPNNSIELIDELDSLTFSKKAQKHTIYIRNTAEKPLFFTASVSSSLKRVLLLSYTVQKDGLEPSKLLAPDESLPIDLFLDASAEKGDYSGEIVIEDAFGQKLNIPLDISIASVTRKASFMGIFSNQEEHGTLEKIQDELLRHAANNDGVLTPDEAFEAAQSFPPKDVLLALQQLQQEGHVEQSQGIYIFKDLIRF